MTFLPTSPPLAKALAERGYTEPTPVQTAVLADAAEGRDLLVSARTGSGKTVAYGLAMAKNLLGCADRFVKGAAPLALIVAPTRELALQVHRELAWLYQHAGARVVSCVGGMDPRREQRELATGAHIVVGTPGRLCDHMRRGRLDVSKLEAVVLDEADEMLDLGFREDVEFILQTMPDTRRTLLFSATLPRGIVALAKQYQQGAFRIEVAGDEGGHADIEYRAIKIVASDAEHAVVNLLRLFESPGAIVFCNTRNAVKHLQAALLERGFSAVALSGELTQNERTLALQALRDGRARVCVATDVAARGIDLPNLGLVIHADLPHDPEVMQHRSGRTGRAGRKGVSVLLVPVARRRRAELLLSQAGIDAIWGIAPKADEIRKLDQERMLQDALFSEETTEDDLTLARALLAERSPEDIAAALARLYRSRLPSPEEVLDPGQSYARSRDDRDAVPGSKKTKPRLRETMMEGSVWFRMAIGHQKNAEARWLLPLICRRGGVEKHDIGAIRIFETNTEFEISVQAAHGFAVNVRRSDKQDGIRIEALPDGPQGQAPAKKPAGKTARKSKAHDARSSENDRSRSESGPKHHGKPPFERPQRLDKTSAFEKEQRRENKSSYAKSSYAKSSYARKPRPDGAASPAAPVFGKKRWKNANRG
ncbi:ATP-dependent RNA helicase DeaD [Rhizobiales bacterium GAS113]|nr:ATP-dependent RNA helicase DeaD [Rhizobiales bacterium GAS113]